MCINQIGSNAWDHMYQISWYGFSDAVFYHETHFIIQVLFQQNHFAFISSTDKRLLNERNWISRVKSYLILKCLLINYLLPYIPDCFQTSCSEL